MKKLITALTIGCLVGFGVTYSIYNARLAKAHNSIRKYTEILSGISIDDQKAFEAVLEEEFSNKEMIDLLKEIKNRGDPLRFAEEASFRALTQVATLKRLKENKIELIEKSALNRVFDYYEDYRDFDFGDGPMGSVLKKNFEIIESSIIKDQYWIQRKEISNQSVDTTPVSAPR